MSTDAEIYFIHGTSIDSRVWNDTVINSIANLFAPKSNTKNLLFDWNGANNTGARNAASERLIALIEQQKAENPNWNPKSINFVGHSHGGTIILLASARIRELIGHEIAINFLTINTPSITGGATLEDLSINHYHVYCKSDLITPRAGYNRTGILLRGGESKNWFGKPSGGEYSKKKDMGSGIDGSTSWEFKSAQININYKDQYRFKGLSPRTHIVSHRGWLEKNVDQWLPQLINRIRG